MWWKSFAERCDLRVDWNFEGELVRVVAEIQWRNDGVAAASRDGGPHW